jgi:hypothetical protein
MNDEEERESEKLVERNEDSSESSEETEKGTVMLKRLPFRFKAGSEFFSTLQCPQEGWNALLIGDAHMRENKPSSAATTVRVLRSLITKNKVKQLFLLGDIFHYLQSSDENAFQVISQMRVEGTTIFVLPGLFAFFFGAFF